MEIVKKNLFSIICGVIALLAVGALYWPISNMYVNLGQELDHSMQTNTSIDSLLNTTRQMPQLSPDQSTTDTLDIFPNDSVIAAATAAVKSVSDQATALLGDATAINKHALLLEPDVPGELPKPTDQIRFQFANRYFDAVNGYKRWQAMLDSTTPPTPAEVLDAKNKLQEEINKQRLSYDVSGNVDPQSQTDADEYFNLESPRVQPRMELDRAKQHRIYMMTPPTVNSLPIDSTIKVGTEPTAEAICKAQVVMWLIDDAVQAIAQTNDLYSDPDTAGGPPVHDILHAAVKSIESMEQPIPVMPQGAVDANAGVTTAAPNVPSASPTGRVCNGRYDVLRFKLHLLVDAAKLPMVIKTLETGRFITVLNVQINEVIDPVIAASNPNGGFRYGNKPVIRCELDCEELLMRTWTDALFPDDMKNGLGSQPLGGATDNGQGQGMPGGGYPMYPGGPFGGPGGPGGPGGYGPPGGGYGPPR